MEKTVAYLSQEWRDEVEKRLNAEITPEKMKGLTTTVAYVYVGCPSGKDKYLYFKTENGTFARSWWAMASRHRPISGLPGHTLSLQISARARYLPSAPS
jgi:hypothetical protein